jgi:TolA-binding protein
VVWCVALASAAPPPGGNGQGVAASYDAAVALQDSKAYARAAEAWQVLLEEFPEEPLADKARYYLGICFFQQQQHAEAETVLKELLAKEPDFELADSALYHLGLAQFSQGSDTLQGPYEEALKTFQDLIARFPHVEQTPAARFYLAEALFAIGRRDDAAVAYREILRQHPGHTLTARTLYGLGVALQEMEQTAEAGATFDRFLKEFPTHTLSAEVNVRRGDTLWTEGRLDQAQSRFAFAAGAPGFPLADYALLRESQCCFERKDYDGTVERCLLFEERFADSPRLAEALLLAGDALMELERYEQSVRWLEKASQAEGPIGETALVRQALCLHRMGQHDRVLDCLKKRLPDLTTDGAQAAALWLVGESHLQVGRPDDAASALRASLEASPDAPHAETALWRLAQAARQSGARQESESALLKLLNQFPTGRHLAEARLELAELKSETGDLPGAVAEYRTLCKQFPESRLVPRALEGLAWALINQGMPADAEKQLSEMLERRQEPAVETRIRFARATARHQLGRDAEAIEEFEDIVAQDSGALGAKAAVMAAEVHYSQGRLEEAIALCERVVHGYGGRNAQPELHAWQARSLLAGARCLVKLERTEQARSWLEELTKRFPQSDRLTDATSLLQSLRKETPDADSAGSPP